MTLLKKVGLFDKIGLFEGIGLLFTGIPTDHVEAYYPFNNNVLDGSGNGHDGVNTDAVFIIDRNGNANSAIRFNGSSAFVFMSDAILKQATQSLCTWVKWRVGDNFMTGIGSNTNRYYTRKLGVFRGTNVSNNYTANVSDGAWHFLISEWDDDANLKIWIDNVLDFEGTYTKVGSGGDSGLTLAANPGGSSGHSDIDLDDIRIYNRRLNSFERTALFLEK